MRTHTRFASLVSSLFVVLCFGGVRANVQAHRAFKPVAPAELPGQPPFTGRSSGVVTAVGFDPAAGIAYSRVEGVGQATLLGRFTVIGDVAVDVATGVAHGTWTLTAANGDEISLSMDGFGIDANHGFGAFQIVGGTGRFQGATGNYDQIITFAVPLGTSAVIDYTDKFGETISPGA